MLAAAAAGRLNILMVAGLFLTARLAGFFFTIAAFFILVAGFRLTMAAFFVFTAAFCATATAPSTVGVGKLEQAGGGGLGVA